jgi:enoyl-CoA hydratase/carnithine racemase
MSDFTDIEYRIEGPAAVISLNRPEKLNALTYHTMSEIRSAVDQSVANVDVVGIVITGEGRGFCSGLDAQVLAEVTGKGRLVEEEKAETEELPGIFSYLLEVPKPVISAINGVAAGGGLVLALMSDIRIASTKASFLTIFLKRGLIAEHGSSWILPRLMGTGRALDLLWMSDRIDAETALSLGLVEKLVPPDELVEHCCGYIQRLSESVAPLAIAETKKLVYRHLGMGYREALLEADESQNRFAGAPDAAEGARALLEKRLPKFQRFNDS